MNLAEIRSSGVRVFSGAALFATVNFHPGVPARAQEALRELNDAGRGGLHLPVVPLWSGKGDTPKPPPLIVPGKPKPERVALEKGTGPLLAKVDLTALHNKLWRTSNVVVLAGRRFFVSGQQSREGNMHMVLTDEKTGRAIFLRDLDLITGFYSMSIGGKTYRASMKPVFTDLFGSRFQILEGTTLIGSFPLRDIMKGMYEAGDLASLGGKSFRLHYTDQIFENEDGRIGRNGEPLFVLMAEQAAGTYGNDKDRFKGDAIVAADVPSDAYLRAPFKVPPHGLFWLDLKMSPDRKTLEIYESKR